MNIPDKFPAFNEKRDYNTYAQENAPDAFKPISDFCTNEVN